MKTKDFVKVCRKNSKIEDLIKKMPQKEVIKLRADLKRKMSGSSDMISLMIFEVSFFIGFLTLIVSAIGNGDGQTIGFEGAMVAFVLFLVVIGGGVFSAWHKSNHAEALSYLEDYLQIKSRQSSNEIITEEYEQTCEKYRREVESRIIQWKQVRENAEKQIELYKSLLTEVLEEKEEG